MDLGAGFAAGVSFMVAAQLLPSDRESGGIQLIQQLGLEDCKSSFPFTSR